MLDVPGSGLTLFLNASIDGGPGACSRVWPRRELKVTRDAHSVSVSTNGSAVRAAVVGVCIDPARVALWACGWRWNPGHITEPFARRLTGLRCANW